MRLVIILGIYCSLLAGAIQDQPFTPSTETTGQRWIPSPGINWAAAWKQEIRLTSHENIYDPASTPYQTTSAESIGRGALHGLERTALSASVHTIHVSLKPEATLTRVYHLITSADSDRLWMTLTVGNCLSAQQPSNQAIAINKPPSVQCWPVQRTITNMLQQRGAVSWTSTG